MPGVSSALRLVTILESLTCAEACLHGTPVPCSTFLHEFQPEQQELPRVSGLPLVTDVHGLDRLYQDNIEHCIKPRKVPFRDSVSALRSRSTFSW